MTLMQCDGCKRTLPTPPFPNRWPEGWLLVRHHHEETSDEDREYCSVACAVIALNAHLTTQQRPLLKAEA